MKLFIVRKNALRNEVRQLWFCRRNALYMVMGCPWAQNTNQGDSLLPSGWTRLWAAEGCPGHSQNRHPSVGGELCTMLFKRGHRVATEGKRSSDPFCLLYNLVV